MNILLKILLVLFCIPFSALILMIFYYLILRISWYFDDRLYDKMYGRDEMWWKKQE